MLWTIIGILIILWILGLVFKIAGGIIHILLIAAVIVLIYKLIKGRAARH
ncbi:lmo0937 family membrane protein [Fictibacillus enclensis]|nr:lmo0937 family membrane protein [Fictibacillus enclensis]MDM5340876.1 lmo0937 family membrane protein [Fictibacillus enclensis]